MKIQKSARVCGQLLFDKVPGQFNEGKVTLSSERAEE